MREHLHQWYNISEIICTCERQTHEYGRDRNERILQAEEQILERVEEPNISTRRPAVKSG